MRDEAVKQRRRKADEVRDEQGHDQVLVVEAQPLSVVHGHEDHGKNAADIQPVASRGRHDVAVLANLAHGRLQFGIRCANRRRCSLRIGLRRSGTKNNSGTRNTIHQAPTEINAKLKTSAVLSKPKVAGDDSIHRCKRQQRSATQVAQRKAQRRNETEIARRADIDQQANRRTRSSCSSRTTQRDRHASASGQLPSPTSPSAAVIVAPIRARTNRKRLR